MQENSQHDAIVESAALAVAMFNKIYGGLVVNPSLKDDAISVAKDLSVAMIHATMEPAYMSVYDGEDNGQF